MMMMMMKQDVQTMHFSNVGAELINHKFIRMYLREGSYSVCVFR
jgi:hypothetical protein